MHSRVMAVCVVEDEYQVFRCPSGAPVPPQEARTQGSRKAHESGFPGRALSKPQVGAPGARTCGFKDVAQRCDLRVLFSTQARVVGRSQKTWLVVNRALTSAFAPWWR
jgi:hypothetical protein